MDRKIDGLGRVTIPKEVRKQLHINDNEILEMNIEDEKIVLSRRRITPLDMRRTTKYVLDHRKIEKRKREFPKGTLVECINMESEVYPIPRGMRGEVVLVDDIGSVHVHWDNGVEAAILDIPGDALEKVSKK